MNDPREVLVDSLFVGLLLGLLLCTVAAAGSFCEVLL